VMSTVPLVLCNELPETKVQVLSLAHEVNMSGDLVGVIGN